MDDPARGRRSHHQETGESCLAGWVDQLHPFLAHYMDASCAPTGTTGEWNAATGASNGWTEWSVDLSGYAGSQVEVSISYASDWATQNTGVFLDDVSVLVDGASVSETGFEDDLGDWTVSGSPDGFGRQHQRLDPHPARLRRGRRDDHGGHRVRRVRTRGVGPRGARRIRRAGDGVPARLRDIIRVVLRGPDTRQTPAGSATGPRGSLKTWSLAMDPPESSGP